MLSNSSSQAYARPTLPARVTAIAAAGAGFIHAAVARDHFAEWWAFGLFFTLIAVFQIGWALLAWSGPSRRALLVGLIVNAAAVALWAVTRTSGLPFGPDAWSPEPAGVADAACAIFELAVVALGALALRPAASERVAPRWAAPASLGIAGALALILVGATVAAPGAHGQLAGSAGCDATMAGMAHGDEDSMTSGERRQLGELPDVACATAADTQAALDFLHRTIAATARYRDTQAAAAAGYQVDAAFRRYALEHPRARKGQAAVVHAPNPAYRADGKVADPAAPETLIYRRDANGRTQLIGVMYAAPDRQPGPDLAGPYTRWHYHDTCRGPAGAKAPKSGSSCPSGTREVVTGYMMHVWFVADSDLAYAYAMSMPAAQANAYQRQLAPVQSSQ